MKKITALFVIVCIILSAALPAFALERDIREAGTVDRLLNNILMFRSENVSLIRGGGVRATDTSRSGVLIYRSPRVIRSLAIHTEGLSSQFRISGSPDNNEYQTIFASASGGRIHSSTVPGRHRYLRIEFDGDVTISRIEINTNDNFGVTQRRGRVLIEHFDDFSNIFFHTPGFTIDSGAVREVNNDPNTLMLGNAPNHAHLIWRLPDEIAAFKLLKFSGWTPLDQGTENILTFYLSPDGTNWTEHHIAESVLPNDGLIMKSQEMFDVPPGNHFLRIRFNGGEQNWSPRLGTLEIYYGPQPEGSIRTFQEEINERIFQDMLNADLDVERVPNPAGMEYVTIPSIPEVIELFEEMNAPRPRIFATHEDFNRIRDNLDKEPFASWFDNVRTHADNLLEEPPLEFYLRNRQLIVTCRLVKARLFRLGMMWRVTGEEKYAQRAWEELYHIATTFPNWNPQHMLDIGEMSIPFAIGYDWLYDFLDNEQKAILRDAILRHGINTKMPFMRTRTGNTQSINNWNPVTIGGVGVGALAIFEEIPELAAEFISIAIETMPKAIAEMSPDGSYPEGLTYWEFASRYMVYFISSLEFAIGTDFGLTDISGFAESGDFILHASSPTYFTFNFATSGAMVNAPWLYWMAKRFNQPQYSYFQHSANLLQGDVLDLIWFDEDYFATPNELDLPLDSFFDGKVGIITFRSAWEDRNALWIAAKAGYNQASHTQIDIGAFVLDADGMRWAVDPGAIGFDWPGLWAGMGEESQRWTYYNLRAEGQNTLVINPSWRAGQCVYAQDFITRFETAEGGGFGIIDMSNAYSRYAHSAQRGIKMFDGRSQVLIQDEVDLIEPSEVWWFSHLPQAASVELLDNGRAALLTAGRSRMRVSLITPGEFQLMPWDPLPTSPVTPLVNHGTKLAIHFTDVSDLTIGVVYEPIYDDDVIGQRNNTRVIPLADWSVDDVTIATLDSIYIDGISLPNFRQNRFIYTIDVPAGVEDPVPVQAVSSMGEVTIRQAEYVEGRVLINVRSNNPAIADGRYTIIFERIPLTEVPEGTERFIPVSVTASSVPEPANHPENTLDGTLASRWSAEGDGEWIQYDLGEERELGTVVLGIFNGDARRQRFDIMLSNDNENWETVLSTESSGATQEPEIFRFEPTVARFVRIVCFGTNVGTWNSITYFGAYASLVVKRSFVDITNHWARRDIEEMATSGAVTGISAILFAPDAEASHSDFVTSLARVLELDEAQLADVFGYLIESGAIDHRTMAEIGVLAARHKGADMTAEEFKISENDDPYRPVTRAEAAVILRRINDL